jgi:hypothetical protein
MAKKKPRAPRSTVVSTPRKVTIVNPPDVASGAAAFSGDPATYPATGVVQPKPTSMTYQLVENGVSAGAVNPIDVTILIQVPNNPTQWVWNVSLTTTDCPHLGDSSDPSQYTMYVTAVYATPIGTAQGHSDFYRSQ